MSKKQDRRRKWTLEQEQMIREFYPTLGAKKLAARMGVDSNKLEGKAFQMGIKFQRIDWTQELEEEIRKYYVDEGPKKLAARLGIPRDGLVAKARRMGVESTRKCPPKDFQWTEEMVTAIKERYVAEGGVKLAKELGLALGTIRRKASSMGLHTIAGHAEAGRKRALESTSCDIHYFDNWTPNNAWILGFLFADGCIDKHHHSVSVVQSRRDEYAIEFIKKELKANHPIRISIGEKDREYVTLTISSTILVERLMQLGMKPRKTYNNYPYPDIPDAMAPHFARGCIDGDGHISICRTGFCTVGFVGPEAFTYGFRDMLVRVAGMSEKAVRRKNEGGFPLYSVSWSSLADVSAYQRFAYPDGFGFYLKRKKETLDKWLSKTRYPRGRYCGNGSQSEEELAKYKLWTQEERDFILAHYYELGMAGLARKLGRSKDAVSGQVRKLGLSLNLGRGRRFDLKSDSPSMKPTRDVQE